MRRRRVFGAILAAATLLGGCLSYDIVQSNVFSDEDGNLATVEYGRAASEHTNYFISPANGRETPFKSRLLVRVTMPEGNREKAWQCMNFLPTGTMYKTDDEKWMFLLNGFTFMAYVQTKENATKYREVYRGVLCETSERTPEKDDRWKVIRPRQPNTSKTRLQ